MIDVLVKFLFAILRMVIWQWLGELLFKSAVWLDKQIPDRRWKVAIGAVGGLAAFFIIPAIAGLLGF